MRFVSLGVKLTSGFIIHEGHAGPLEVVSADRLAFPMSAWLTWRFDLMLDRTGLKRFREEMLALRTACLELGYDVLARTERRVRDLEVESMPFVNVPLLLAKEEDFSVRYLMEGLISNGICVPSEVPRVLAAIKRCSSLEVKERVLASLFSEDPGCDVPALVSGMSHCVHGRNLLSCRLDLLQSLSLSQIAVAGTDEQSAQNHFGNGEQSTRSTKRSHIVPS